MDLLRDGPRPTVGRGDQTVVVAPDPGDAFSRRMRRGVVMGRAEDPRAAGLRLGPLLSTDLPLVQVIDRVLHLAKAALPSVDEASFTLVEGARPATMGATGQVAARLDDSQNSSGSGPCLDAATTGQVVHVADTSTTDYVEFGHEARRAGVRQSLSLPVHLPGVSRASINLYVRSASPMDEADRATARAFAAHAGVTLASAALHAQATQEVDQLREALASRAVIEQAKGMLMAVSGCTEDDAFDELRRLSSTTERKLRVVARAVVSSRAGRA